MFKTILSAAIAGIEVIPVHVEADVSDGLPQFSMVGCLTHEVKEAQDRVLTSLRNIGLAMMPKHITINMSPADVPKSGSRFDLPIILGILAADRAILRTVLKASWLWGTQPERRPQSRNRYSSCRY